MVVVVGGGVEEDKGAERTSTPWSPPDCPRGGRPPARAPRAPPENRRSCNGTSPGPRSPACPARTPQGSPAPPLSAPPRASRSQSTARRCPSRTSRCRSCTSARRLPPPHVTQCGPRRMWASRTVGSCPACACCTSALIGLARTEVAILVAEANHGLGPRATIRAVARGLAAALKLLVPQHAEAENELIEPQRVLERADLGDPVERAHVG